MDGVQYFDNRYSYAHLAFEDTVIFEVTVKSGETIKDFDISPPTLPYHKLCNTKIIKDEFTLAKMNLILHFTGPLKKLLDLEFTPGLIMIL